MIWLMLPAYLANPAAAISAKIAHAGRPIDAGKCYKNNRILGDGKTYKGLFSGIGFGIFIAVLQNIINANFLNNQMPFFSVIPALTMPAGSLLGDLTASFFKRRLGLKRGQAFPLVDQLDFVFGAWIFTIIFAPDWYHQFFTVPIILTTLLLTPLFHLLFNLIGYKIGISREPW